MMGFNKQTIGAHWGLIMDKTLLEILACPLCKGQLIFNSKNDVLICKIDRLAFPIRDGIPVMLESESRTMSFEEIEKL